MPDIKKASLFDNPQVGKAAYLVGVRCRCGQVSFPLQTYGCEVCGSAGADLERSIMAARGILQSAVVVHQHADKSLEIPFTIARVVLDAGPMIRSRMEHAPEMVPRPGARVGGRVAMRCQGEDENYELVLTEINSD